MTDQGVDFDTDQIKAMIPHRYPFLLIDRVLNCVADKGGVGVKYVSVDEPYFRNMPPGGLAMPGLLIVEAMAQTAAVGAVHTLGPHTAGKLVLLTGLKEVRFHLPVRPGDTLFLHVNKERQFGPTSRLRGMARVERTLVAEAALTAVIIDSGHDFNAGAAS
ncbi:MAG TPA: 3-hydroxyacyl-ACP dehydratase FabZ [Alphaproteobacteria bacterium]|nr:3-hydroxyacyl-ACP dehydratase FabZ [Alphaproteobacteria bacterium]